VYIIRARCITYMPGLTPHRNINAMRTVLTQKECSVESLPAYFRQPCRACAKIDAHLWIVCSSSQTKPSRGYGRCMRRRSCRAHAQ
jgi:hypothetical protein